MTYTLDQWINIFRNGKAIYSTSDLLKITGYSIPTVRKILERLVKKKILTQVKKETFLNNFNFPSFEQTACVIYPPTYISCESILFEEGILEQSPFILTCVTLNKTKSISTKLGKILYQHIKTDLYFGFYSDKGAFFAFPEKALCDFVYLRLKNGEKVSLDEINFDQIKKRKLKKFSKSYPASVRQALGRFIGPENRG